MRDEEQDQADQRKNQNNKSQKKPLVGSMTIRVNGDVALRLRRPTFVHALSGVLAMMVLVLKIAGSTQTNIHPHQIDNSH